MADNSDDKKDMPRETARLHVLLAEDNRVNQTLAVRLLEKRGHSVFVACNGRQAVDAFDTGVFDLILMDVQMPEMNGYEATTAIREKERETGGHVPIIAMTAHAMKGDRERCLAAGMDRYISKPIDTRELLETVESISPAGIVKQPPAEPAEVVFDK
jgi:CheY-like chemotaxis protein